MEISVALFFHPQERFPEKVKHRVTLELVTFLSLKVISYNKNTKKINPTPTQDETKPVFEQDIASRRKS